MARLTPELRSILRWLRRTHPLARPIRVFFSAHFPNDELGVFEGGPEGLDWRKVPKFRIRLRPGLPAIELREVLLHEWAHGLTVLFQDSARSRLDHDSIYTYAYTDLIEEFKLSFPHLPLRDRGRPHP